VTIDGFWIDDQISLFLCYSVWLHFTTHSYTHIQTSVHNRVFTCCCLVVASNGGYSPSSGFPNYPRPQLPASHSYSSQQLNPSSSLSNSITDFTNSLLTDWLTSLPKAKIKVRVMLGQTVSQPVYLSSKPHLGPKTRLNLSSSLTYLLTNSVTYRLTNSTQLTLINCPAFNISAQTTQKTPFHYCCAIVAMETCFFAKLLLSNGYAQLLLSRSFPSNGFTCHNMKLLHFALSSTVNKAASFNAICITDLLDWVLLLFSTCNYEVIDRSLLCAHSF
jgi:hypothetical protein